MANVDYGAVTRMLDRLEEKKMLVRKAHGEDRRSVRLEITPEGRRMVDLLQPIVANWMRKYFSPLNESEKESFARAMVALIEADSGQNESDM